MKWSYVMVAFLVWIATGFWLMHWGEGIPPAPTFDRIDFQIRRFSLGAALSPASEMRRKGVFIHPAGFEVGPLDKGGAAEQAGLQVRDILTAVDGISLEHPMISEGEAVRSRLDQFLANQTAGHQAWFSVFRDGKTFEATVATQETAPAAGYKLVPHTKTFRENSKMTGKVMLGALPIWGILIRRGLRSKVLR